MSKGRASVGPLADRAGILVALAWGQEVPGRTGRAEERSVARGWAYRKAGLVT